MRLAILKLASETDPGLLHQYVEIAKRDYRDVLAQAEFPGQLAAGPVGLSAQKHRNLQSSDREQYETWCTTVLGDPPR